MSVPGDEVVERGRAIFEQLRQGSPDREHRHDHDDDASGETGSVDPPDAPVTVPEAAVGDADPGNPGTLPEERHDTPGEPAEPVRDLDGGTPDAQVASSAEHDADTPGEPAEPVRDLDGGTPDAQVASSAEHEQARGQAVPPPAAGPSTGDPDEPGRAGEPVPFDRALPHRAPPDGRPEAPPPPVLAPPPHLAPGPVPLGMPPDASLLIEPTGTLRADPASYPSARFARELPRVMAIANQKGGVGKTTTAVNLGAGLAELGFRVLVVDLDPQGNATTGLGINPRNLESSIYDVMMHDVALDDCIEPTSLRNLFVCPATIDLAGAEIELVPAFSRELKLRRALEPVLEDFDFVVIDCPPSLGLITINALAAASEVVVPIQCEYYALEGLGQLLRNVKLVQTNLNPRLEVSAIILTMFDARTKLAEQVATEVRKHFGPKVCRNIVPRTVRLSEAPSFGQPIVVFDPTSRGAIAYRELAKEVSGGASQRVG